MDPYDESRIRSDDLIIRRINPKHHLVPDADGKTKRVSTKAFKASSGPRAGMSVDIEDLIKADSKNPKKWVVNPTFTGAASLTAAEIRGCGLWVGYEPLNTNPYHGEVWRGTDGKQFTTPMTRRLLAAAEWYVEISGVKL